MEFLGGTFNATEFTMENSEEEEEEETDNEDIYSRIFCLYFCVLPVENFLSVQLYVDSTQGRAKSHQRAPLIVLFCLFLSLTFKRSSNMITYYLCLIM